MPNQAGGFRPILFGALSLLGLVTAGRAEVKVFILSGQSNMVGLGNKFQITAGYLDGAGKVSYYESTFDFDGNPEAGLPFKFSSPIKPGNACERTSCTSKTCYTNNDFGPEVGIAKVLAAAYPNDQIVLIKAAWGGTGLAKDWLNPASPVYPWFLDRTRQALADARIRYRDNSLTAKALIWLQGEADASFPEDALNYQANLAAFIRNVRRDIAPDLPFLYGTIQNARNTDGSTRWPEGNAVVRIQKSFRDLPNLGCTRLTSSAKATVYPLENEPSPSCEADENVCSDFCLGFNKNHYDSDGQIFVGESLGALARDFLANGSASISCKESYLPAE